MKKQTEQRSPLIPKGIKLYESGGLTFGGYLKMARELQKKSAEEAAKTLDISTEYYIELETDKRFAPTGKLYYTILKNFNSLEFDGGIDPDDGQPSCTPINGGDWGGSLRDDVPKDMVEFLRRNWFGRYVAHALMQIEPDVLSDDEFIEKMQELILNHAKVRKIEIPEMPLPDYSEDDDK